MAQIMLAIQLRHRKNEKKERIETLDGLKFDAGKSIRYHSHLRCAWRKTDHFSKAITLFSGTSTAFTALSSYHDVMIATSLITALFSCLDLVLGFSDKIRLYDDLYKNWSDYLVKLERIKPSCVSENDIIQMKEDRLKIERDEPDVMRIMERYSSAEECDARGLTKHKIWELSKCERWFCCLIG